jgi:lysozyme
MDSAYEASVANRKHYQNLLVGLATAGVIFGLAMSVGSTDTPARADMPKIALTDDWSRDQLFKLMNSYIKTEAPPGETAPFALNANFRFAHDALWRNPLLDQDLRVGQIFGIDISHHNVDGCHCDIDWNALANQKVTFAYLKATQGTQYFDKTFDHNLQKIRKLPTSEKIEVGAYHFLSAEGSGKDQAANYLDVTKGKIGDNDLAPVVDLEWDVRIGPDKKVVKGGDGRPYDFWTPIASTEILKRTIEYLETVRKATHKVPVVYTNQVWWRERIGQDSTMVALAPYHLWISDLSASGLRLEKPALHRGPWNLWQFTFSATADAGGLPPGGTVDASVFNGTPGQFASDLKSVHP